ncbi:P-loop NTPase fold protein [Herbivorax sp. ANBcel31]|uniref:KAP family P-loop NTPase fold protein n=1 Tax=Herbivorax sp. ANBcel31 TaxID=3069754 RepID=UPI0027B23E64|nr:P-loop NTPase fold protein [Herbivorax sp. ANBcel31]MDQ2085211.1 P-loop NTPase fold protein [Herbivorax sp. ANBcel31]
MSNSFEHIEINAENPFKNDKFNREVVADNLESLIKKSNDNLVISIDANWGMGKTTFVNMWRKKLDNIGDYKTVYFSAWENDDSNDPLVSIICNMEKSLSSMENYKTEKIKEVGKHLIKKSVPIALKILTHGLIDTEKLNISDFNKEKIVELAGEIGSIELEKYKEEAQAKEKFKEELKNYQQSIDKKIIFFIDELDRCRPTYAIETLERIKHLFNIEGYIFILSLDKSQLRHCVKLLYGNEVDSVGYLRRFIDLEYSLPEPDRSIYLDFLINKFEFKSEVTEKFFIPYLKALVTQYNLSLRDINKLMYYLHIIFPRSNFCDLSNDYKFSPYSMMKLQILSSIYSLFPVLRIGAYDKYQKFLEGDYKFELDFTDEIIPFSPKDVYKNKDRKDFDSIFKHIVHNILKLHKDSIEGTIDKRHNNYSVNFHEDAMELDLSELLDSKREKLKFINNLEFADRFDF